MGEDAGCSECLGVGEAAPIEGAASGSGSLSITLDVVVIAIGLWPGPPDFFHFFVLIQEDIAQVYYFHDVSPIVREDRSLSSCRTDIVLAISDRKRRTSSFLIGYLPSQ